MSRGQGGLDARELVFREGFVGIDTPLEEELAAALEGVPYKIYVGVVRLFRGRPAWTTMRELAEQLHQDHGQVVKVLPQLEVLHLIAYETTARGTRLEVLPCSAQALVALRQRAEERLGAKARFSRRANQRLARARDELGLPQPAPQPPRPKRRRPSGGRAAGPGAGAGGAEPARQPPASEVPAWGAGGGPPGSFGGQAEGPTWAAASLAPQLARLAQAQPPSPAVELASEPPPAPPTPSPEPQSDSRLAGGLLASQPDQPPRPASQPPAVGQELASGESPAASQPTLGATAGQPGGVPAADPETPAALAEASGQLAPPAGGLPGSATPASFLPQPASDQPAEARTEGGLEATDEGQGGQPASGGAGGASQEPTEMATPGEESEAEAHAGGELAAGGLGAQQVAPLGGVLTPPPGGVLTPPPEGGAPNCSLDPFLKIPPSFPPPPPDQGAPQPEGGKGGSLVPPAVETVSRPAPATNLSAQPPASELPPTRPALAALDELVALACSLWPQKLHRSAAERWLRQAIALVEPAPSLAEMTAFLRWVTEEESLKTAVVRLAVAVSPERLLPWMKAHRADRQRQVERKERTLAAPTPPAPPGLAKPSPEQLAQQWAEAESRRQRARQLLAHLDALEHPSPRLRA